MPNDQKGDPQVNYWNQKIVTESKTELLVELCHVSGVHTIYSHQPSPAQPSPAQPSIAATVQQVWESAGGFYAFIQYFYVCCLLYSDPESK